MTEPLYETDEDRQAENEIIEAVAAKWRCQYRKLPYKNWFDYALLRDGEVKALAEARCRKEYTIDRLDELGGVLLSVDKALYGFTLSDLTKVDLFFLVRCNSKTEIWRSILTREMAPNWKLGVFNGNAEFRREADKELCFYLPKIDFTRIL